VLSIITYFFLAVFFFLPYFACQAGVPNFGVAVDFFAVVFFATIVLPFDKLLDFSLYTQTLKEISKNCTRPTYRPPFRGFGSLYITLMLVG
jgi:hypothetical protein